MADANPSGVSGARIRAAGKAPAINATTQILQASGKAIGMVTADAAIPRVDTVKVATGRITAGAAGGRIGAAVTPVIIGAIGAAVTLDMTAMIAAVASGARVVPTGQIEMIIGEDAKTTEMTAASTAGQGSDRDATLSGGENEIKDQVRIGALTAAGGALIAITAGITAEMIAGMIAGSGKHKRLAPEGILSGFMIPATAPKSGATITSRRFLRG